MVIISYILYLSVQVFSLKALKEQNELESLEYLKQIQYLQKEISCSSSSILTKERENLRKDLDKTKVKLKETESKLRNVVQEKTKLEVWFDILFKSQL